MAVAKRVLRTLYVNIGILMVRGHVTREFNTTVYRVIQAQRRGIMFKHERRTISNVIL